MSYGMLDIKPGQLRARLVSYLVYYHFSSDYFLEEPRINFAKRQILINKYFYPVMIFSSENPMYFILYSFHTLDKSQFLG